MREDLVRRDAVMRSLTAEYNRRRTNDGLRLAWIEKAVDDVPASMPCGWIPVSERLPDNDEHVLCTTIRKDGTAQVVRGYYDSAYKRWVSGMNSNVVAWMPMPDAYEGAR